MTTPRPPLAIRSRRRRRRVHGVARWLVRLAVVLAAFALGIAVGQALEDRPPERDPVTNITTIEPWTRTS